jgi:hypothetical protein
VYSGPENDYGVEKLMGRVIFPFVWYLVLEELGVDFWAQVYQKCREERQQLRMVLG